MFLKSYVHKHNLLNDVMLTHLIKNVNIEMILNIDLWVSGKCFSVCWSNVDFITLKIIREEK